VATVEHNVFELLKMMDSKKNKLLIGVCKNLDFEQLKPFVRSAKEYIDNETTHFVMISIDDRTNLNSQLIQEGWSVVALNINSTEQIHMERFKYVTEYLLRYPNYDYCISCDVRDVIFQADPFEHMKSILEDSRQYANEEYFSIVNTEAIRIRDEQWNSDNIKNCYGDLWYENVKDAEVMNVGILSGYADYIRELCNMIYLMSQNRNDWVSDQASFNIIGDGIAFNAINYYQQEWDLYSVNLHITHHPDCVERLAPFWTRQPARFINGQVCGYDDEDLYHPYTIVHQYDRDETMREYFTNKYK